jgi:hypothetical protein
MANPIIVPKKSTVSSKVPITSDLALGEIAINHADKKLYARHPISGTVQEIGSLTAHSHDQLISVDSTADLELQNNGSVIITDGAVSTTLALSSTIARTITFPDKTGTIAFLDDVGSGGVQSIGTSAADVLSIAEGEITADDPGADRLLFWDESESKLTHLTLGTALTISGTTLNADTAPVTTNNTYNFASKTLARFTPRENQPPATAFATLDTRNSIAVLDFDAATDESAIFSGVIPENANLASGLQIRLTWMATSDTTTTRNCRWGVQIERCTTDLDADSFDTATEANGAPNATSGIPTVTSITVTAIDDLTAGDTFRIKIFRNADDATNDTMTGDAELIAVEVRSAA